MRHALARFIGRVRDSYDFILIDCPLAGILTLNALVAADVGLCRCKPSTTRSKVSRSWSARLNASRNLEPTPARRRGAAHEDDPRNNLSTQVLPKSANTFTFTRQSFRATSFGGSALLRQPVTSTTRVHAVRRAISTSRANC